MENVDDFTPIYASPQTISGTFGISRQTIYRLIEQGELVSCKVGKSRRILIASVHSHFEKNREKPVA